MLALSEFFFVKIWSDSDLVSIGELQLLWEDKNSEQVLSSLRLYFLPENTPEGRSDDQGEVSTFFNLIIRVSLIVIVSKCIFIFVYEGFVTSQCRF